MEPLFSCPLCAAPLTRQVSSYTCPAHHNFDRSSAGYVHLLPANKKHSKSPGDDKAMVAARSAFLEKGHYQPLLEALSSIAVAQTAGNDSPVVLDSGCGQGYYTAGIFHALEQAGQHPRAIGVDLSKFALRRAAKALGAGEFALASVYHLPVLAERAHLLLNVFSPLAVAEFARVLRTGGLFCYVVPSPLHLWEMKQVLYPQPYENPVKIEPYHGFTFLETKQVRYPLHLTDSAEIMALFQMTPYAWKTPRDGVARLAALRHLDCQIGFDIHLYQKGELL